MRSKLNLPAKPIAAFLLTLLLALTVSAQTTNRAAAKKTSAPGGNRFLFIVDTSSSMKSTAGDVQQAIGEILRSSASGQIHPGDTIGVWTFNRELYPGVMPLQTWRPDDKEEIALRTLAFLKSVHYKMEGRFPAALEGMYTVIKASDIITVFIISDGRSPMQGTPFDQQINALYYESVKEMKKNRKPIVTVLQAKRGKVIKYTVNALPWPVVIPEVPIPIKGAETAEDTSAPAPVPVKPAAPAPAPKIAPPLIVEGNQPPAATTPAPAPVIAPPTTPAVIPQTAETKTVPPPPAKPQSLPVTQVPPPAPKPLPAPLHVQPIAVAQNPVPTPPPSPVPASPVSIPVPKSVPPSDEKAVVARTEVQNTAATTLPPRERKHTNTLSADAPANTPAPRVLGFTLTQPKVLLIGAIVAAVIAFSLVGLLLLRLKAASGPSFITRTMGNPPRK